MTRNDSSLPLSRPISSPLIHTLETRDFDELSQSFSRWDQRIDQIGHGKFLGRIRFVDLGSVQLFDVATNLTLRARGSRASDFFTFTPVTSTNAGAWWRGSQLAPGMINVLAPETQTDHRTCPNYRMASILVHRDLLQRASCALLGVDHDRLLARDRPIRLDPTIASTLVGRLHSATAAPATSITRPLSQFDPTDLVEHLVGALAQGRVDDPIRSTPGQRLRVVREVEALLESCGDHPLSIVELCELTGVSARTLHYAFEDVTGLTPKAYIRSVRLNRARRDLLQGPPVHGLVADVARRHGFHRSGNFASDYRRLFGVLPSAAVRHPRR